MKAPRKSFEIALSGIACAVAALALTLASYVDELLAAGYLIAVFALMIPLTKDFPWGSALAYLGGTVLAVLFSGIGVLRLLPFAAFFGLHPIANHLEKKYVKKKWMYAAIFPLKAAWFDLSLWLSFVVFAPIFGIESATWYPFVQQYFVWVLIIGGTLLFALYDGLIFLCQRSMNALVGRIGRR